MHNFGPIYSGIEVAAAGRCLHCRNLGPVDKPVLAPARSERLGRRDTHVATVVAS
jgi:hypothetical protein